MKAVKVMAPGGSDQLQLVDLPDPVPAPSQVLIRVVYTGLNYADLQERKGTYAGGRTTPYIPGLDVAGVVVEMGKEVTDLVSGQPVLAFPTGGSYAELVVAERNLTFALPDGVSYQQAAAPVICGAAWGVLHVAGRVQSGESILIHSASGGIGSVLIQLAKLAGCPKILATVGSNQKKEHVLAMGVDDVCNYLEDDHVGWTQRLTAGAGVDLIANSVAGTLAEKDLACLADFGRLVLCGKGSGQPAGFSSDQLHKQNRAVIGFSFGHIRKKKPVLAQEITAQIISCLGDGSLKVPVGAVFSLKDAGEAHRLMESRSNTGKFYCAYQIRLDNIGNIIQEKIHGLA